MGWDGMCLGLGWVMEGGIEYCELWNRLDWVWYLPGERKGKGWDTDWTELRWMDSDSHIVRPSSGPITVGDGLAGWLAVCLVFSLSLPPTSILQLPFTSNSNIPSDGRLNKMTTTLSSRAISFKISPPSQHTYRSQNHPCISFSYYARPVPSHPSIHVCIDTSCTDRTYARCMQTEYEEKSPENFRRIHPTRYVD